MNIFEYQTLIYFKFLEEEETLNKYMDEKPDKELLWTSARIRAAIEDSNKIPHIWAVLFSISCSPKIWEGTRKGFQEKLIFANPYPSVVVFNVGSNKYMEDYKI